MTESIPKTRLAIWATAGLLSFASVAHAQTAVASAQKAPAAQKVPAIESPKTAGVTGAAASADKALTTEAAKLVGALKSPAEPSDAPAVNSMSEKQRKAFTELHSNKGPVRFALVSDKVYRGGLPTAHQVELLHELGVTTIVNLRHGHDVEEEEAAKKYGMKYLRFPFYGTFDVDSEFLTGIVSAIRANGTVYVHCHAGRDRTSLVVAMYRVIADGWSADRAWQAEALDFGHRPGVWYRAIGRSFQNAVQTIKAAKPL